MGLAMQGQSLRSRTREEEKQEGRWVSPVQGASRIPANADDEVISSIPGNVELAAGWGEVHRTSGGVILIVVCGAARHGQIPTSQHERVVRPHDEVVRAALLNRCLGCGNGECWSNGGEHHGEVREGNHDDRSY